MITTIMTYKFGQTPWDRRVDYRVFSPDVRGVCEFNRTNGDKNITYPTLAHSHE